MSTLWVILLVVAVTVSVIATMIIQARTFIKMFNAMFDACDELDRSERTSNEHNTKLDVPTFI